MSDDRRVYPRYEILAQVRVREGLVDHVMEILNISRGGALVDLGDAKRPRWVEIRRELDVRLFDTEGATLVETGAHVVRIVETLDSRTFAVEFDVVQDDETIRRACASAAKPPPLPPRPSEDPE